MVVTAATKNSIPISVEPCHIECGIYPCSDGEPMADSDEQAEIMLYLFGSLRTWYQDMPDVYVSADTFVYYRNGHPEVHVAPDVFVAFGVEGTRNRKSWKVWEENGVVPAFVLEVASESTREEDEGDKRTKYAMMGVPEYCRINSFADDPDDRLALERLTTGRVFELVPVTIEASGRLRHRIDCLGLDICLETREEGLWVRLYDPVTRTWLLSQQEENAGRLAEATMRRAAEERAEAAEERAEREVADRRAAQERIRELEELLTRMRPDSGDSS